MPSDIFKKRKIAVLGSRSVGASYMLNAVPPFCSPSPGKSALVVQFTENHFVESYHPTIENTFNKAVSLKGIEYDCDIIDTAGQVRRPTRALPADASISRTSSAF